MSALERLRRAAAAALLRLYPEAWRVRYGTEMRALIDDDPPAALGLASLLGGALHAHLRPRRCWRDAVGARRRMRLSIGALLACWMLTSLAGIGFQKITEEPAFATASEHHWPLAAAHAAILAGALLGAAAIAFGGLPLLASAVGRALRRRDVQLLLLLARPLFALAGFTALTALLLVIAPARGHGFPTGFVLTILVPWTLAAKAVALTCALTARAVLRRIELPCAALRRASLAGIALALAMCVVAAGLLMYVIALAGAAPALSAQATGPYGASTGASLAGACASAVVACALGLVAATCAGRAALGGSARDAGD